MNLKNNSQCPECAGRLKARYDMTLICIDCKAVFVPVGDGIAETELEYRKVRGGKHDSGKRIRRC